MENKTLIKCENVSFAYEGKKVVTDLSFTVEEGDYFFIAGENGTGKSTLIKGLLGLKTPCDGTLTLYIKPREIGYLPQQTPAQKGFPATVREVVISGRLGKRGQLFYTAEDKRIAAENIAALGLESLTRKCYRELSGGQQQRVLIARALCAAEKALLLDEPVSGLDPKVTAELYGILQRINRDTGVTIIMVSHDVANAAKFANKQLELPQPAL
ncbi:zinc ABC transporter ATP-binding protein [Clostridia bacterium]|nr:zinc ABC transporter ATP-binding protein [Clostridia bacterium]